MCSKMIGLCVGLIFASRTSGSGSSDLGCFSRRILLISSEILWTPTTWPVKIHDSHNFLRTLITRVVPNQHSWFLLNIKYSDGTPPILWIWFFSNDIDERPQLTIRWFLPQLVAHSGCDLEGTKNSRAISNPDLQVMRLSSLWAQNIKKIRSNFSYAMK